MARTLVLFASALAVAIPAAAQSTSQAQCAVSETVFEAGPPDPNASPIGLGEWYVNQDRSIRVAVPAGGWSPGGKVYQGGLPIDGEKTYWVRPQGTDLVVHSRRLDVPSEPLAAHVPCCYPTGFQIAALRLPTEGCWEVTATAGDKTLTFVTSVGRRAAPAMASSPPP